MRLAMFRAPCQEYYRARYKIEAPMNDPIPTKAKDMFCHAVYSASHVINRAYTDHLAQLGLTYPQYITLTLLWETDQQTVGALGHQLEMKTSTMTPLIKRLETLGFVKRLRGEEDERQVFVHLTSKGAALQDQAPNITSCMIKGSALSQSELDDLTRLLSKLRSGFNAERGK
jgi:DNA-binding MarR family transcriptional regulator